MRYRKQSPTGDYMFGHNLADFHINTPAGVGQAVKTRLLLMRGEWFIDNQEGTPYNTQILGKGTLGAYDRAIKQRILDTTGVTAITQYTSVLNPANRALTVSAIINTVYGITTLQQVI